MTGTMFFLQLGEQRLSGKITQTGSWDNYENFKLGKFDLPSTGEYELRMQPQTEPKWRAMRLRTITLKPVD